MSPIHADADARSNVAPEDAIAGATGSNAGGKATPAPPSPDLSHDAARLGEEKVPANSAQGRPIADVAPQHPERDYDVMIERSDSFTDTFIPAGTTIRYVGTGNPEYGVVVHCWRGAEIGMYDCYVAFFGSGVPAGKPAVKPYVLRYAAISLARLEAAVANVP